MTDAGASFSNAANGGWPVNIWYIDEARPYTSEAGDNG
jgi:hypothetical protein